MYNALVRSLCLNPFVLLMTFIGISDGCLLTSKSARNASAKKTVISIGWEKIAEFIAWLTDRLLPP